jgi:thiol-disulfide isomerase/thioredoxin
MMGSRFVAMRPAGALVILAITATVSQGAEIRPLALVDLDGAPVEVSLRSSEAGVVVHFWATWCPSCIKELAALDVAARACPTKVRIVAVNVAEAPETIRNFLADLPIAMTILRDATGEVWQRVSGRGLPVNLVWTHSSQRVEAGARDEAGWARLLKELGCE